MLAGTEERAGEPARARFEKWDIVFWAGIAVAVLSLVCILTFAEGEKSATLGILWGWLVNLSIWIYLIVSAI